MDSAGWAVVAAVAAGIGAAGAVVSSIFAYRSIRLTQRQQQTALVVARLERTETTQANRPYVQGNLLIENRGPAVARNVTATVMSTSGGSPDIGSGPDDTTNADGSVTIHVDALAPGASCWRPSTLPFGRDSHRAEVDLKWHDDSGQRSDRHVVELI